MRLHVSKCLKEKHNKKCMDEKILPTKFLIHLFLLICIIREMQLQQKFIFPESQTLSFWEDEFLLQLNLLNESAFK